MRYALAGTVVVTLGTFRYLDAACLTMATEEGLGSGVNEVHTVDAHEVVVETHGKRIGDSHETALSIGFHIIFFAADVHHDIPGLRGTEVEVCTTLLVHLRECVTGDGSLCCDGICGYFDFLVCYGQIGRTFGFETEVSCHGLTVAATQFAISCRIEV